MTNNSISYLIGFVVLMIMLTCSISLKSGNPGDISMAIAFHAENEAVREVLKRLANDHGLNLTYNSSNEDFNARISYRAENKKPEMVLSEILALINHEYTSIGNQLVIHRSERFEKPSQKHVVNQTDTILRIVEIPVVVVDTIVVVKTKTEYVQRAQHIPATVRPLIVNRPSYRPFRIRSERFSLSLSYAQMLAGYNYSDFSSLDPDLQEVRDADGVSFRNFMISSGLHYQIGAVYLSTSLSVHSYSIPFNYKELFTSGGYHRVDTLDSFYTIVDGEQIWTHITDSIYIPIETRELQYDRTNNMGMLGIRFNIAYDFYISNNSNFFIHGGLHAAIPLWQSGNTITNTDGFPAAPLQRNDLSNITYGFHLGPGVRTRISDRLDFVISASYQQYLTDIHSSYPLNRNLRGVSFQIGFQHYI